MGSRSGAPVTSGQLAPPCPRLPRTALTEAPVRALWPSFGSTPPRAPRLRLTYASLSAGATNARFAHRQVTPTELGGALSDCAERPPIADLCRGAEKRRASEFACA